MFSWPVALIRSSSSRWIASQIAYPYGLITIAPRTAEFSARPARRTTSPYQAGKSPDWVGKAFVLIGSAPFVDVDRRNGGGCGAPGRSGGSAYAGTCTTGGRGATAGTGSSSPTQDHDVMVEG